MDRVPVTSSAIVSVGHDASTRTLEVEFQGGSTYQYFDVPAELYLALLESPSLGRFHAERVRGVFRYVRI